MRKLIIQNFSLPRFNNDILNFLRTNYDSYITSVVDSVYQCEILQRINFGARGVIKMQPMINWWGYFNLTIILIYNTVMPIITLVRTCYTGASTCMPVIIVRNLFQTFLTGTLFLMAWVFIANAFTYKKSFMFYISKHLGRLQFIDMQQPSILFHILTINLSFFFQNICT